MSFTTSFIPADFVSDVFTGTISVDLGAASDSLKIALYDTSYAQTVDDSNLVYSSTNEVTGTNWSAGGVALATTALGFATITGGVKFDAVDVSVASTTISTAAFGCLIYDTTVSNRGIVAVYFGNASGYTTNNGTFAITWDSSGIFTIDLSP